MVRWTWWDSSLSLGLLLPSVLWHCWLGHLTRQNPSPLWPIMCLLGRWTLLNQSFDGFNSCLPSFNIHLTLECGLDGCPSVFVRHLLQKRACGDKWCRFLQAACPSCHPTTTSVLVLWAVYELLVAWRRALAKTVWMPYKHLIWHIESFWNLPLALVHSVERCHCHI